MNGGTEWENNRHWPTKRKEKKRKKDGGFFIQGSKNENKSFLVTYFFNGLLGYDVC